MANLFERNSISRKTNSDGTPRALPPSLQQQKKVDDQFRPQSVINTDTKKKGAQLSDQDALDIGRILGWIDKVAKMKARRFYSYLKGEVKNRDYDEYVHYGDKVKIILPILEILKTRGYYIPQK